MMEQDEFSGKNRRMAKILITYYRLVKAIKAIM